MFLRPNSLYSELASRGVPLYTHFVCVFVIFCIQRFLVGVAAGPDLESLLQSSASEGLAHMFLSSDIKGCLDPATLRNANDAVLGPHSAILELIRGEAQVTDPLRAHPACRNVFLAGSA